MKKIDLQLAEKLLSINAITMQPDMPFVLSAGLVSPVYTDNRRALSYPQLRTFIKVELSRTILECYPDVEGVVGVASAAIAQGALVADALMLPYAYVRPTPKDHGLENLIEGNVNPGQKIVVIEEIVSTGTNSLHAVEALKDAGCNVLGVVSVVDFEFADTQRKFKKAGVKLNSLTQYSALIKAALSTGYLRREDVDIIDEWHHDPINWIPQRPIKA